MKLVFIKVVVKISQHHCFNDFTSTIAVIVFLYICLFETENFYISLVVKVCNSKTV